MFYGNSLMVYHQVYVVFEDDTNIWWLRWLRRGFRHCYILVPLDSGNSYFYHNDYKNNVNRGHNHEDEKNDGWLSTCFLELNPMFNIFYFNIHQFGKGYDYIEELRQQPGFTICAANVQNPPLKVAPHFLFSCVEFAKRTLGLHERWVFTPYQLYKKITSVGKKS